jgi:hypothetical protein
VRQLSHSEVLKTAERVKILATQLLKNFARLNCGRQKTRPDESGKEFD